MASGAQTGLEAWEARQTLLAFRAGNEEAFEALFRLHQRSVYGWILRIVRDQATAEDLTIETFWRIFRAHGRFEAAQGFEGWARRIATHAALDWMRSVRTERELRRESVQEPVARETGDAAVRDEIRRKTALAFERLAPKLRIAAVLAVIEEQPYKEVAEALGISVAAVKVRVFRALRILRKDLEQQGIRP